MDKIGIIDIGSNSVRLMISVNGVVLSKQTVTTRLGESLSANGFLLHSAISRTVDCVCKMANFCSFQGVNKTFAFATAAVRNAQNGKELVDAVLKSTGINVDVVSGDKEALLAVNGALKDSNGTVIDLGGGSTEISVKSGGKMIYSYSLPYGCVSLKDLCGQERSSCESLVNSVLNRYGNVPYEPNVMAVGGTATNLAAILMQLQPYDPDKVNGYKITFDNLSEITDRLYSMSVEERKDIKGINVERADVIACGSLLLFCIAKKFGYNVITVSESDNLEGYLKTLLGGN